MKIYRVGIFVKTRNRRSEPEPEPRYLKLELDLNPQISERFLYFYIQNKQIELEPNRKPKIHEYKNINYIYNIYIYDL